MYLCMYIQINIFLCFVQNVHKNIFISLLLLRYTQSTISFLLLYTRARIHFYTLFVSRFLLFLCNSLLLQTILSNYFILQFFHFYSSAYVQFIFQFLFLFAVVVAVGSSSSSSIFQMYSLMYICIYINKILVFISFIHIRKKKK